MKGLIVVLLIAINCNAKETLPVKSNPIQTKDGRFQLIQLGDLRKDQYLIDTHTGLVWMHVCSKAGGIGECLGNRGWEQMQRYDFRNAVEVLDLPKEDVSKVEGTK